MRIDQKLLIDILEHVNAIPVVKEEARPRRLQFVTSDLQEVLVAQRERADQHRAELVAAPLTALAIEGEDAFEEYKRRCKNRLREAQRTITEMKNALNDIDARFERATQEEGKNMFPLLIRLGVLDWNSISAAITTILRDRGCTDAEVRQQLFELSLDWKVHHGQNFSKAE